MDTLNEINIGVGHIFHFSPREERYRVVVFHHQHDSIPKLGGGYTYFLFSPRKLGKIPMLTNIFSDGLVQPPTRKKTASQAPLLAAPLLRLVLTSGANSLAPPFRPPPGLAPPPSPVSICSPMSPLSPKTPGGGYRYLGFATRGFCEIYIYIRFKKWRYYWFSSQLVDLTQRMYMYEYMLYLDLPFLCQIWCQKSQKKTTPKGGDSLRS